MQTSLSHTYLSSFSSTSVLHQTMVTTSSCEEMMVGLTIQMIEDELGFSCLEIKSPVLTQERFWVGRIFHKYVILKLQKMWVCLMESDSYHLRTGFGMVKASTTIDQALGLLSQTRKWSHMKSSRGAYRLLQKKMQETKKQQKCLQMP